MISAGSDEPGPGVMSSGERTRHLHGGYSDRSLNQGDTLQLECTPTRPAANPNVHHMATPTTVPL